jgi:hypothetical protein
MNDKHPLVMQGEVLNIDRDKVIPPHQRPLLKITSKYIVHWMRIVSKDVGTQEIESEFDLLRKINRWNASTPGVWVYWY